mgnify:CR=1 FL=1
MPSQKKYPVAASMGTMTAARSASFQFKSAMNANVRMIASRPLMIETAPVEKKSLITPTSLVTRVMSRPVGFLS